MLDDRNLKTDLAALALLAGAVFLALALFTYDPADPPARLVSPPRVQAANACGGLGAYVAHGLFELFGLGAYYLAISLLALDLVLLARGQVDQPWLRGLGWGASLLGLCSLASLAAPGWSPGPVIGSGGYVGATARSFLEARFASAGAYIMVVSVILGGWLLSTDYVLVKLSAMLFGRPVVRVGRGLARVSKRAKIGAGDLASNANGVRVKMIRKQPAPAIAAGEREEEAGQAPTGRRAPPVKEAASKSVAVRTATPDLAMKNPTTPTIATESTSGAPAVEPEGPRFRVPKKNDRDLVMSELDAASQGGEASNYELPGVDLLLESEPFAFEEQEKDVRRKAKVLEATFANFGFNVRVVEIETGPVIAQFEVELEAGLRLSKITSLADDLAIALRVPSVRIVAPIPGKNTVGIEVPNSERQLVRLREVIEQASTAHKMRIPIFLGKDVAGNPLVADLASLPHLLIAGRTGTGKSVCLNTIIVSMLMTRRPDEVRMLMIDPKMVELSPYKTLPHLMHPVVTDMRKAEAILAWAVEKMEERYSLLARAGVRHISGYNQLGEEELMDRLQPENDEERAQIPTHLPYIVIVADEMADLMMTSAKEVETHIIRLAQKSRAVGIHLVLATQKPTVDVITGLIKSNLPARICFQVASRTDSRVVLDEMGADKLLGNGDMLFLWPGTSTLLRGQGTYVSDEEISRIVEFVGTTEPEYVNELVQLKPANAGEKDSQHFKSRDDLYEAAIDLVVREGRGSVSLLQRALGIGYGRGARLIDFMAEDGIVGAYNGSQAREVLITVEQWEEMCSQNAVEKSPPVPSRAARKVSTRPVEDEPEVDEDSDDEDSDEVDSGEDDLEAEEVDEDDDEFTEESDEDEDADDDEDEQEVDEGAEDEDAEEEDEEEEEEPEERPLRYKSKHYKAESA